MIELKDILGNVIYSTEINNGAKRKYQLMQEDYITLPFSLDKPINFGLGTYVDIDAGLFEVIDLQKPTYNNTTGGYDYQLRLDAYYWKWKNKIFKFTPEVGGQEASWSLTASLDVHLDIFLKNLKALGYTYRGSEFEFSIDATVENKAMSMTYSNMNMIDALSAMAESWECEWWITDNIIHFGRCEYGTSVDFEIGVNVAEMTSSASQDTYATRLYIFGSDKNLPSDYRPIDENVVVNGVVQKRLMLPVGTPYIDAYEGMSEEEAIEEVVVFDEILPKFDGNVSAVITYDGSVENEDGTTTTETFYRFQDDGILFSKDYILEGQELRAKFTSGQLNGMEFGLVFNPKNLPEKFNNGDIITEAQLYEVVANEDYGRKLPDATLHPQVGDSYVLIGWDSTKIADLGLVDKAEKELLAKGQELLAKRKIDPNTYNCKMFSDYMYGLDEEGNQDNRFAKHFDIGDKVKLINSAYFNDGRESRIIGYEYNLDYPFDNPVYTVGETASYSRLGELESKIDALTYKGQTYTGAGGSGVYVIGTNDSTRPTNRNVFSALRSDMNFLSKLKDDRSKGKIATDKAVEVGEYASGTSGAIIYIDSETGQTIAELDKLYVRMKAYFETLEIVNVNSVGGKQIISPAGGVKCIGVEVMENNYRCYFLAEQDGEKIENRFKADDLAYSQTFNASVGVNNQISNHYYWRLVVGVSTDAVEWNGKQCHYLDLSVSDCDTSSDVPKVGDVICHRGNRTDVDRQNFIEFSSVDAFSPSITLYQGVNSYSLVDKAVVQYGVDKTSGKAFMNVYGDMYVGDRNGDSYMRYTQENGLEINGKLDIGTKLGDKTLSDLIKEATPEGYVEFVNTVTRDLEGLRKQVDGAVDSYFFDYDASLENYPANEWSDAEKESHINDTFTNNITGDSWRWGLKDGVYQWIYIEDTATKKALATAAQAQDTADGKRRVFVNTPTSSDAYDIGDMWVNATHGGYTNEVLRATTKKEKGVSFSLDHWIKASKYTDDTVAQEALSAANKAQDDANTLSSTVTGMRDFTDSAFSDGVVSRSEKSSIEAYLNQISTVKAQVDKSYEQVYNNTLLTGTAKTNLNQGYTAFNAACEELIASVNNAIKDGVTNSTERADVDAKYTNFNSKYSDYTNYLNAAIKAVEYAINDKVDKNIDDLGGFEYLKKALKEDTSIEGGLIQSSIMALGYTDETSQWNVMAGTSGIYDKNKRGGGIAAWYGGANVDLFDYYNASTGKFTTPPSGVRPAAGVDRMDGTGYRANGAFWWDLDGNLHADPLSFFVGESRVGGLLASFDVKFKEDGKSPDYLIPKVPLQSPVFSDKITLNGGALTYDARGFWKLDGDLLVTGGVTMYANDVDWKPSTIMDAVAVDGVTITKENGYLQVIGGTGGGEADAVAWQNITGKPSWVGDTKPSYAWSEITGRPTLLSSFTNDVGYVTKGTTLSHYGITDNVAYQASDNDFITNGNEFNFLNPSMTKTVAYFNYRVKGGVLANPIEKFVISNGAKGFAGLEAKKYIVNGGTSSQFLKADGSLDSNSYALSSALSGYLPLTGGTLTGDLTIQGASKYKLIMSSARISMAYNCFEMGDGCLFGIYNPSEPKVPQLYDGTTWRKIYHSGNLTKAVIQSTLGVSDWALAASKPGYSYNEIADTPVLAIVATTGRYSDLTGLPTIPTALKNPYALTFGTKTYDGSAARTILASDLGALTTHQAIYALTIKNSGGTALLTYTPNSAAAAIALTKVMVGLGNVENTALSTWAGSANIKTVGTITSGTWNGTAIANGYLANSAITINGALTSLGGSFSTASITAGTAGTSSATSGYTLAVPYVTMNKYGIVTGYGTHTHTINSIPNSSLANSSMTIAGTSVSLGGSITAATLKSNLGLGSLAYVSSLAFSSLTGKPTTLAGYGITDALPSSTRYALADSVGGCALAVDVMQCSSTTNSKAWDDVTNTSGRALRVKFYDVYDDGGPTTYGNIMEIAGIYNHWKPQIWFDSSTGQMRVRNRGFTTNEQTPAWNEWRKVLDHVNYSSYALPLTGGTISGRLNVTNINGYTPITSGNIGSQSVSKANALKGTALTDSVVTTGDTGLVVYAFNVMNGTTGLFEALDNSNSILTLSRHSGMYDSQLGFSSNGLVYYRAFRGKAIDSTTSWRTFAFTDSNVASATKLQTARTLWGQSFDGAGDVSGSLKDVTFIRSNVTDGFYVGGRNEGLDVTTGGLLLFSYGATPMSFHTNSRERMHITSSGNVGIGTIEPAYRLDVNGSFHVAGSCKLEGAVESTHGVSAVSIELKYTTPFIDFHFNNTTTDYTSRIIETASGTLNCYANWTVRDNLTVSGTATLAGAVTMNSNLLVKGGITQYSARALKNIVDESGLSLNELSVIKPTRYTWRDGRDNDVHIGGIADDVQRVLPEVVYDNGGVLTMDYAVASFAIASSLIHPVIDHERRIAELERENKELKLKLKELN